MKQVFVAFLSFSGSLVSIVNTPDHIKCMSLNNQQWLAHPTLISLQLNECIEGLRYYQFAVNLDRCMGSCNTLNDLFNKVCILHKTEDLNLSVINIITGINELKMLTKYISCECQRKFDGRKCKSNQKWKNDRCLYDC